MPNEPTLIIRNPENDESLQDYITSFGIEHFGARELLRLRKAGITAPEPPRSLWPRIIPTLQLSELLRASLGHPLVVGNAYRPPHLNAQVGGAKNSQHIHFSAMDIDLPSAHKSREERDALYREAGLLFLRYGDALEMGFGLYARTRGTRIHIDTGSRKRYWKREYVEELLETLES